MDIGLIAAKIFGMSDEVWRRHANPWSGWSRVSILPLIALAAWSRVWIDYWAFGLGVAIVIWSWLNPRIFPEPKSLDNWMSKGVLGEQIWLRRHEIPIPFEFARITTLLNMSAGLGAIPFIYGIIQLDIIITICGMVIMMLSKLWFIDRMVWLFELTNKRAKP
ncbi:MAG: hypothetical protein JJ879_05255 [Sneathiella sp.]|nr:hypothetical protein [Sneathiella sp.]